LTKILNDYFKNNNDKRKIRYKYTSNEQKKIETPPFVKKTDGAGHTGQISL
jgi:hypothetical protein